MNDSTAWLRAAQRDAPTVRLPSWIPSVQHSTAIDEECSEACAELEAARAELDQLRRLLEVKEREARSLMAQLEAASRECQTLRSIVDQALGQAERARSDTLASAEPDLVQLAAAIAQRVVSRELTLDPSIVVGWAHEGITALHTREDLIVALSPELHAALPRDAFEVEGHHIEVVLDDRLPAGSCEVRSRSGRVEENVTTRISAIIEALGSES